MIQRTLLETEESPPAPAFAKAREPETANDIKEWSRLFQANYGKRPETHLINEMLDKHEDWQDKQGYRNYRRSLK